MTTYPFSLSRENIIEYPEKFVSLYTSLEVLGDNSQTLTWLELSLIAALQEVRTYGKEVGFEEYFASIIVKFLSVFRYNKRLRAPVQELTKFIFEATKFDPVIADAYMIDDVSFIRYFSRFQNEKETKEWLLAHPEAMYDCFVAKKNIFE